MTPIELATLCTEALARPAGLPSLPVQVILSIPKGSYPKHFPRGELLNERRTPAGIERTYAFDAERVLDKLVSSGVIRTEMVPFEEHGIEGTRVMRVWVVEATRKDGLQVRGEKGREVWGPAA